MTRMPPCPHCDRPASHVDHKRGTFRGTEYHCPAGHRYTAGDALRRALADRPATLPRQT